MQPAISTLILYKQRFGNLTKILENNQGIANWEIIDEGFHGLSEEKIKDLKGIALTHSLRYSVHAPFSNINLAETDPVLRNMFIEFVEKSLMRAYRLEAEFFIIHPGRLSPFTYFFPEEAWKAQFKSFRKLIRKAEKFGINVMVENMIGNYDLFKTIEDGIKILENTENISICLDVGHANVTHTLKEFILKMPNIQHIHVHDNNGTEDAHLTAGYGTIDWITLINQFKTIGYKKWIVAENYELPHALQTLTNLKLI